MEESEAAAGVMVRVAVPLMPSTVAVSVVAPEATPVARPALLMVATAVAELVQVTAEVTLLVEPSLKVAIAAYCWVAPGARVSIEGVMAMEVMVGVGLPELEPEPEVLVPGVLREPHPVRAMRAVMATRWETDAKRAMRWGRQVKWALQ